MELSMAMRFVRLRANRKANKGTVLAEHTLSALLLLAGTEAAAVMPSGSEAQKAAIAGEIVDLRKALDEMYGLGDPLMVMARLDELIAESSLTAGAEREYAALQADAERWMMDNPSYGSSIVPVAMLHAVYAKADMIVDEAFIGADAPAGPAAAAFDPMATVVDVPVIDPGATVVDVAPPVEEEPEADREAEEAAQREAEEAEIAAQQKAEEEAALQKAEEEAAALQKAEEEAAALQKAEEEAAAQKAEEEAAAQKKAEEEAAAQKAEEEAAKDREEEEAAKIRAEWEEAANQRKAEEEAEAAAKREVEAALALALLEAELARHKKEEEEAARRRAVENKKAIKKADGKAVGAFIGFVIVVVVAWQVYLRAEAFGADPSAWWMKFLFFVAYLVAFIVSIARISSLQHLPEMSDSQTSMMRVRVMGTAGMIYFKLVIISTIVPAILMLIVQLKLGELTPFWVHFFSIYCFCWICGLVSSAFQSNMAALSVGYLDYKQLKKKKGALVGQMLSGVLTIPALVIFLHWHFDWFPMKVWVIVVLIIYLVFTLSGTAMAARSGAGALQND